MARFPSTIAEGKSPPFPQGTFIGVVKEAKDEWYASSQNAPDTKDAYRINLSIGEIAPADSTSPNVGGRPCSQRIDVIRPNKSGTPVSLVDVTEWDDSVPFGLRQSATLLLQLALALGAATLLNDGSVDCELEQFIEGLHAGAFNGRQVMFATEHRTYTSKTAKNADGSGKVITASNISAFKGVGATVAA